MNASLTSALPASLPLAHTSASLPGAGRWLSWGALVLGLHALALQGDLPVWVPKPPPPVQGIQTRRVEPVAQTVPSTAPSIKPNPAPRAARAAPTPKPRTPKPVPKPRTAALQATPQSETPPPHASVAPVAAEAQPSAAQNSPAADTSSAGSAVPETTPTTASALTLEPNQPLATESTAQNATKTIASEDNTLPGPPAYVLGPVAVPAPQNLRYAVSALRGGLSYSANGELSWWHDGSRYELRMTASALWLTREFSSAGQLGAWGLEPQRYGDKTNRRERAAHFLHHTGQVSFSNNRPSAAIISGGQDRVSTMLQLTSLFAGAPDKYPAGSTVQIQVASAGEAGLLAFKVDGAQTLDLPSGAISAVKLSSSAREGRAFDERLELWLAPEQSYLPARIKYTQANGDFLDLVLR